VGAWALPNEGQPLHTAAAQGPDVSLRCEQVGLEVQHLVPQVLAIFLDLSPASGNITVSSSVMWCSTG
jgi:hypothetical protein